MYYFLWMEDDCWAEPHRDSQVINIIQYSFHSKYLQNKLLLVKIHELIKG